MSGARSMAAGLSDVALEGLASRGLVRRAQADVTAGKISLLREAGDEIELMVDGQTVRLASGGPAKGSCSCPAPGICRHKLAAILYLRGAERTQDGGTNESAKADWKSVFEAITPAAIERFAGKTGWADATGHDLGGSTVEDQADAFTVQVAGETFRVIFLPKGGLAAAITKAPARSRKALIAAAALAARNSLGLTNAGIEAIKPAPVAKNIDTRALADARHFLERAFTTALAVAPAALEDEARQLALSSRVDALPRLGGLLRSIASAIAALRRRNADADPDGLLGLLAQAYALCMALEKQPVEPLRSALAGVVRQDYAPTGDTDLYGLGARLWQTASGAHGVTTHLFAPASGESYTLTLAHADHKDVQFHPKQAFHETPIWGEPMSRLCGARVAVTGALASASGRLSTSTATMARVEDWSPERDRVRQWACAFDDWERLQAYLQARFAPRLANEADNNVPVVLIFTRHASASFDEITQTLNWPLADAAGRWIGLSLDYDGEGRARIPALEQAIRDERFWGVLANAFLQDGRLALQPYALWGSRQILLDFQPSTKLLDSDSFLAWMRKLRLGRSSGPTVFAATNSTTNVLLDRAWDILIRRAEAGERSTGIARDAAELSQLMERAGLGAIGRVFARLANTADGAACLRAAYAVTAARQARASLPWMV